MNTPRKYLLLEFDPVDVERYGIQVNEYGYIYCVCSMNFSLNKGKWKIEFIHEIEGETIYYLDYYDGDGLLNFLYDYFGCYEVLNYITKNNCIIKDENKIYKIKNEHHKK